VESDAFAHAVEPLVPTLLRLAARVAPTASAEDVVQDALVRAWRHRKSFDPAKGAFRNWLLRIVANEAARSRHHRLQIREISPSGAPSPDEHIDIENALKRLPPRQRLAVDCYYFVGMTIAETADAMDCSEGTVKSTLSDARHRLKIELKGQ
jgi:RNA polymerase sigma factor (sigma-70 family)